MERRHLCFIDDTIAKNLFTAQEDITHPCLSHFILLFHILTWSFLILTVCQENKQTLSLSSNLKIIDLMFILCNKSRLSPSDRSRRTTWTKRNDRNPGKVFGFSSASCVCFLISVSYHRDSFIPSFPQMFKEKGKGTSGHFRKTQTRTLNHQQRRSEVDPGVVPPHSRSAGSQKCCWWRGRRWESDAWSHTSQLFLQAGGRYGVSSWNRFTIVPCSRALKQGSCSASRKPNSWMCSVMYVHMFLYEEG